jgi:succinate dehydrogenase/fumarate reductase flavoprotein subunit
MIERRLADMRTFTTDVLVIGGGSAAIRAAIEAAKAGVKVRLVDKGKVG